MVKRLNTCCGCGELRTGTIIIGGVTVLIGALGAVFSLVQEAIFDLLNEYYINNRHLQVSESVMIILGLPYLALIAVSIIMIVGGVKKNWKLILPWLILDGIVIGLQLIAFLFLGILIITNTLIGLGILYLVLGLAYTVLSIYLWYVPFSYHLNLKDESRIPVSYTNITPPVVAYTDNPPVPPKNNP